MQLSRVSVWIPALLITALTSAVQVPLQSRPTAQGVNPASDLTTAAITALTMAVEIEQSVDRIDRGRLGSQNGRFDASGHARRALDRARDAQGLFSKPFGPAGDPLRKSGEGLRAPFAQLTSSLNEAIGLWDKMSLSVEESEQVDMVRSSEGLLGNERPWDMLVRATQDLTLALLDVSRAAVPGDIKSVRHLRLTRAERDAHIARIEKAFPRVTSGARGGRAPDVAAGILHEFLTRPYASQDEP